MKSNALKVINKPISTFKGQNTLHPIAKNLGYPTNEAFYNHYPTQDSYQKAMLKYGGKLPKYTEGGDQSDSYDNTQNVTSDIAGGLNTAEAGVASVAGVAIPGLGPIIQGAMAIQKGEASVIGNTASNSINKNLSRKYAGYGDTLKPAIDNYSNTLNKDFQQDSSLGIIGDGLLIGQYINAKKEFNKQKGIAMEVNSENAVSNATPQFQGQGLAGYKLGGKIIQYIDPNLNYKNGGKIHINPANKGKFNALKARTGKSTEELTHSSNPLTRKRAIFAQNASKWKHADGGSLDLDKYTGPTHEQGGIPVNGSGMPVSRNQASSEVEGGESKYGDYIFSNTLGIDKSGSPTHQASKVSSTFSDLAKKIDKKYGSKEDAISQKTKEFEFSRLQSMNDTAKANKEAAQVNRVIKKYGGLLDKYMFGGNLEKYPDGGDIFTGGGTDGLDYLNNPDNIGVPINTPSTPNIPDGVDLGQGYGVTSANAGYRENSDIQPLNSQVYGVTVPETTNPVLNPLPTNTQGTPGSGAGTGFKPSASDISNYIGPTVQAIQSLSRDKNYLQSNKNNSRVNTLLSTIPTKYDISADLYENQRSTSALQKANSLQNPSVAASANSQLLSNKLYGDNKLFQEQNNYETNATTNKLEKQAAYLDKQGTETESYNHQYNVENNQDAAARRTMFNSALSNVNTINNQKTYNNETENLINNLYKNYQLDPNNRLSFKFVQGANSQGIQFPPGNYSSAKQGTVLTDVNGKRWIFDGTGNFKPTN